MKKLVFLFLLVGTVIMSSAQTRTTGYDAKATIIFQQILDTVNYTSCYKITKVIVAQPSNVFADLKVCSVMGFDNQDTLPGSDVKFYNFTILNASTNEVLYGAKSMGAGEVEMKGKGCYVAFDVGLTRDKSKVEIIFDDEHRRMGNKHKSYIKGVRDDDMLPAPVVTPVESNFLEENALALGGFIFAIFAIALIISMLRKRTVPAATAE